ncbi:hypothetical protein ZOSMA_267G00230 [Zostera marina]|uniref:Protein ENHANCED DISEASE RESISTANCE 2 C-terminal domain-containing protein n=1 Tax=Zostera marina TaxID=29655 RepID=A0A0K9PGV5_ZOSMR|nr:hypothetical protein ZOSMA_267G00230 [Zostera marina]
MAGSATESGYEWIEKVKSGGSLPLLESDSCPDGWAIPSGNIFKVRGPDYFSTNVKIPGGEYLLKPLGFDWIKGGGSKICEVMNNQNSRIRKALDDELAKGSKPFIWAFNLQIPSRDNYSAVAYFVTLDPIEEESLMGCFLKGDDAFRNSKLKLIANIFKGPWIVRKAVGEQAICILGRAVSCKYILSDHFIEIDIDIGASMVANAIVHLAFGYITSLTVDLAFLIESQNHSELPERILGGVRISELSLTSAGLYEFPPEDGSENLNLSLSSRLWKSFGLSHLLHPDDHDKVNSPSSHLNGVNHVKENEDSNSDSCVHDRGLLQENINTSPD